MSVSEIPLVVTCVEGPHPVQYTGELFNNDMHLADGKCLRPLIGEFTAQAVRIACFVMLESEVQ